MKITVTGGSGFLGSHVADELSKRGHKVKIFDRKKSMWKRPDQKIFIGDILNYKDLESAIKGADAVFHFAALADIDEALKKPIGTAKINISGTVLALEMSYKYKIKRFVHASSIYVNSNEGGFYRCSKKAAEDYVEEYHRVFGLNYTVLRFGSLYGERSDNTNGLTNIINSAIANNKISYMGGKSYVREYIHVLDAAKASADILKDKYKNQHIVLTGKKRVKIHDCLKILAKILKISKKMKFFNKRYIGHYTTTPFTYKPKEGKKFIFGSQIKFNTGLLKLVNNIKKHKKIK
jgi:UDP-glucose 4-epimerase|tara:strand:- start:451 stop:1326 length:876 start_codon:yes stop_codon:yes gene_type:complete